MIMLAVVPDVQTVVPGIAGWIIAVLMGVTTALAGAIVWMQRRADRVYGYRLAERDTLNKALVDAAAAQQAQAAATRDRNQLQQELTETIAALSQSIAMFIERQTIHHEHLVTDADRVRAVIEAIAEAMRNATLQTTGVKDKVDTLLSQVPGMTKEIKEHIKEELKDLVEEFRRATRHRDGH